MISYLFPTHDRPDTVFRTLARLGTLPEHEAELIIIDNVATVPARYPSRLINGIPVHVLRHDRNNPCAARNMGVMHAEAEWIVMLDDDSYPLDLGHMDALRDAARDVAAIGADIMLPDGNHEAGGLPEVFIGCGVAIRKSCFERVGGYDPAFDYYAEEYDLAAKFIRQGWRIVHDRRFRIVHEKVMQHRDMNRILHRLVRNNGWVMQQYAPQTMRENIIKQMLARYRAVSVKEDAETGYMHGLEELKQTIAARARTPMSDAQWARFTGRYHAQETLACDGGVLQADTIALVEKGKHAEVILEVLNAMHGSVVDDPAVAGAVVIGTLSPGPMLDAYAQWIQRHGRVSIPWRTVHWHPMQRHAGEPA